MLRSRETSRWLTSMPSLPMAPSTPLAPPPPATLFLTTAANDASPAAIILASDSDSPTTGGTTTADSTDGPTTANSSDGPVTADFTGGTAAAPTTAGSLNDPTATDSTDGTATAPTTAGSTATADPTTAAAPPAPAAAAASADEDDEHLICRLGPFPDHDRPIIIKGILRRTWDPAEPPDANIVLLVELTADIAATAKQAGLANVRAVIALAPASMPHIGCNEIYQTIAASYIGAGKADSKLYCPLLVVAGPSAVSKVKEQPDGAPITVRITKRETTAAAGKAAAAGNPEHRDLLQKIALRTAPPHYILPREAEQLGKNVDDELAYINKFFSLRQFIVDPDGEMDMARLLCLNCGSKVSFKAAPRKPRAVAQKLRPPPAHRQVRQKGLHTQRCSGRSAGHGRRVQPSAPPDRR